MARPADTSIGANSTAGVPNKSACGTAAQQDFREGTGVWAGRRVLPKDTQEPSRRIEHPGSWLREREGAKTVMAATTAWNQYPLGRGADNVNEPLSRDELHQRTDKDRVKPYGAGQLEGMLDAVLARKEQKKPSEAAEQQQARTRSPIDMIRDVVAAQLVPTATRVAERYRPKGFDVAVDAADLLGGGRDLTLDICFGDHRLLMQGTAMPEGIAFNETLFIGGQGGTLAPGPMLRNRRLSPEGFADFLYERMIALAKAGGTRKPN